MDKRPCVYMLASRKHGTLYVGVTSDLRTRLEAHRSGQIEGFTKAYKVHRLVYVEFYDDMVTAITREKQIKKWERAWKVKRIEQTNPEWLDLAFDL